MLEVDKVNVFYGQFQALRDVSLKVNDGELVALLGPNGHGKSTLLKALSGLISIASGSVKIDGKEITRLAPEKVIETGLVYIAEERYLFPDMTVLENLKLGAYNANARKKEAENLELVFQLFPALKSWKKRPASTLSGGEGRMLAIGRGLMSSAGFLCLDEPSFGLAPILRDEVFQKIGEIHETGVSILLVEQSVIEASELADRIYLMEHGSVVLEGTKEQVLGNEHVKEVYLGI